ncbi:autotransporter domain-containing protein [Marinobacter sp.]|uniref:autotransporter domain-containing protein n=1 Tax=Marinobacter sp. TaxID=50741 RepID=UPI003A932505
MENRNKIITSGLLLLSSPYAFAAVAVDDYYTLNVQQPGVTTSFAPALNDIFDDGFTGFTLADFELVQGQGIIRTNSDGSSFEPAQGFIGTAEIRYTIEDNSGSDQASVYIEVTNDGAPIQAVRDTFYLPENTGAVTLPVRENDWFEFVAGFPAFIASTSGNTAQGGTVTTSPNSLSTVEYTPPDNFTGVDTFNYTLEGPGGTSQTTVTVNVGVEPGQNGVAMPDNLTPEEASTFAVVVEACEQESTGIPCEDIADLTPEEQKQLAQQLSGQHAKLQVRAMRQLQRQQSSNINARLKEIRAARNPISIDGLNLAVMGKNLPLAQALQGGLSGGGAGDSVVDSDGPIEGDSSADDMSADDSNGVGDGEGNSEWISPWGAFINGKISVGESNETANRPSYDQDGYSVTLGLDYRFSDTIVVGAAAGLGESDTDFTSMQGRQNAQSFSLVSFGNYYPIPNLYIDGLAMWTQGDLDVRREVNVASIQQQLTSDTSSRSLTAATSIGYEFNYQRWQNTLYGRLEYSDLNIDGYTEKGGSLGLTLGKQKTDSLISALGTRVGYAFSWSRGVLIPSVELEYIKENSDDVNIRNEFTQAVTAGSFNINADEPDTEYMSLSTSVSAVFSGGRSAFIRYETLLLQDSYDFSSYSVGFRAEF